MKVCYGCLKNHTWASMYYNTLHPARTEEKLLFKNAIKTNHPAKLAWRRKKISQHEGNISHPAQADNVAKLRAKYINHPAK